MKANPFHSGLLQLFCKGSSYCIRVDNAPHIVDTDKVQVFRVVILPTDFLVVLLLLLCFQEDFLHLWNQRKGAKAGLVLCSGLYDGLPFSLYGDTG